MARRNRTHPPKNAHCLIPQMETINEGTGYWYRQPSYIEVKLKSFMRYSDAPRYLYKFSPIVDRRRKANIRSNDISLYMGQTLEPLMNILLKTGRIIEGGPKSPYRELHKKFAYAYQVKRTPTI